MVAAFGRTLQYGDGDLTEFLRFLPGEVGDDGLKFSTTTGYLSVIKQHLRPTWGTVQLTDIRPLAVQEWLKQIDLSRKTRQNIKAVFHRIMELAMLWGFMPAQRNPLSLMEIKGGSSRPRPRRERDAPRARRRRSASSS